MLSMPTTRSSHISERDMRIHEMVCRRDQSLASIGKQFGLTAQRVHQIARKMDGLLFQELAETVGEIKARQTATLRHVAQEAMVAWQKSQGDHEVIHERTTKDGMYREVTKSVSPGNPAYLTAALKAMDDIRKIWGVDAPKQVHIDTDTDRMSAADKLERITERMQEIIPAVAAEVVEVDAVAVSSGVDGSIPPA